MIKNGHTKERKMILKFEKKRKKSKERKIKTSNILNHKWQILETINSSVISLHIAFSPCILMKTFLSHNILRSLSRGICRIISSHMMSVRWGYLALIHLANLSTHIRKRSFVVILCVSISSWHRGHLPMCQTCTAKYRHYYCIYSVLYITL